MFSLKSTEYVKIYVCFQVELPQKEDDYQEYTENFDGFRSEDDTYMSKLDIQYHSK